MARIFQTKNKADIVTGFDITADFDIYGILSGIFEPYGFSDKIIHELAKGGVQQIKPQLDDLVSKAEEIFLQEASLSRWSGNMVDNSVVGVSGTLPTVSSNGESLHMDIRIGVNHKAIMNPANWQSHKNKFYGKSKRFVNPIIYTYNGKRMKPGVDYSMWLESGTAKIPNAALWEGFVERAEERFDNL